jgi:hypothetical protein
MVAANLNHTIIIVLVTTLAIRVGVDTMIKPSIDDLLVLAWNTVFALALAGLAPHEPYCVGNEFHWGAKERGVRLGARRAGAQVRSTIQIGVGAWVAAVGHDACLVDPERVTLWEFQELPGRVL